MSCGVETMWNCDSVPGSCSPEWTPPAAPCPAAGGGRWRCWWGTSWRGCTAACRWSSWRSSPRTYRTVQYSTVQYSTVQYSTVQYSTVVNVPPLRGDRHTLRVRRPDGSVVFQHLLRCRFHPTEINKLSYRNFHILNSSSMHCSVVHAPVEEVSADHQPSSPLARLAVHHRHVLLMLLQPPGHGEHCLVLCSLFLSNFCGQFVFVSLTANQSTAVVYWVVYNWPNCHN